MRWTTTHPSERVREGFLWLPVTVGSETRWLEWARWLEVWGGGYDGGGYVPSRWLT